MTLENPKVIDAISFEQASDTVVLSLVDEMDWTDFAEHISALQNKLNYYIEFVESQQIYADYPLANGRRLRIDIYPQYDYPQSLVAKLNQELMNGNFAAIDLRIRDYRGVE